MCPRSYTLEPFIVIPVRFFSPLSFSLITLPLTSSFALASQLSLNLLLVFLFHYLHHSWGLRSLPNQLQLLFYGNPRLSANVMCTLR
jgi:hypothetical protein